jgi:hypothetical protein
MHDLLLRVLLELGLEATREAGLADWSGERCCAAIRKLVEAAAAVLMLHGNQRRLVRGGMWCWF